MLYCTKTLKPGGGESVGYITRTLEEAKAYARSVRQYAVRIYDGSGTTARPVSVGTWKMHDGTLIPILGLFLPVGNLLLNEHESKAAL